MTKGYGKTRQATPQPVMTGSEQEARRRMRRSEGVALALIVAMMAAAWVMMLKL